MARLKDLYKEKIIPKMAEHFGYKNIYAVPRLQKIVVNMAVGEAIQNPKVLDSAARDLAIITGQRPIIIKAKKSVSAFKLRKGKPIACKVTLRGKRMYEFFDRLITFAIPRVRDFRGLNPNSFDGRGNYNLGIKEETIFPEIKYDQVKTILGMDVTIITTAQSDEEGYQLLKYFGMPFKK